MNPSHIHKKYPYEKCFQDKILVDFPGGAVVKNLPANARNTGSGPGRGRSHMLWSD